MGPERHEPPAGFPSSHWLDRLSESARERLGQVDGDAFRARVDRCLPDLVRPLLELYADRGEVATLVETLLQDTLEFAVARPSELRELDRAREADPDWFKAARVVGYVCYADRFAGNLEGVRSRLDYLAELGVGYLHLMPLLEPREGESDGGYAVADYDAVDPRLGTMADLTGLAQSLHERDMTLCIDLAINHTAREHDWAALALAGDNTYRDYYLLFPDRTAPDAFEETVPDIFPEMAPGSFTHVPELDAWVWTTFREFQWDLNYANPDVFRAMTATMLRLANRGADILRLDAAPFLWKRLGTTCQDLPETHLVLQAFRAATRIAAPGLLLKAEAMVAPELLGRYLGDHEPFRPECDLAYDNQLMVMLWSGLATGSARLATQALGRRRPAPASTTWVTYVRCHDDIGWAVSDTDATAVGLDGPTHRRFLSDFFAGDLPGSFARGERFQASPVGEAAISGTAASLCGVELALAEGDGAGLNLALRRLETVYSVVFSLGGIPLLYMGDELALLNDTHWADQPEQHGDNRWLHRPPMDWDAAARRHDLSTVEGQAFQRIHRLVAARRSQSALGSGETTVLTQDNPHVLCYRRGTQAPVLALVNFSTATQVVNPEILHRAGITQPAHLHSTTGHLDLDNGELRVPAAGFVWITTGSTHQ